MDADPAFLRREIRGIDTKIAREQKKINNLLQKINMCNNNIAQLNKTRVIHLSSYESSTGKTYEPVTSSKRARKEGGEAAPTHPSKAAHKDSEIMSSSDEKAPVAPGSSVAVQATKGTGYGKDGGTSVKKPVNGTAKETAAQAVGKAIDKTAIIGTVDMGVKGAADKTVNGATVVEDGHMSAQMSDVYSDNEAMI